MHTQSSAADISTIRARTDRDLIALLDGELDHFTVILASARVEGNACAAVESGYARTRLLIELIGESFEAEKARLRNRLQELRVALDAASPRGEGKSQSAFCC